MDGDKIKYVHLPFCSIFRYEIRVTPRGRELSRGSSIFFFCSHSRVSHRSCKYSLGKTRFAVANRVQAFTKTCSQNENHRNHSQSTWRNPVRGARLPVGARQVPARGPNAPLPPRIHSFRPWAPQWACVRPNMHTRGPSYAPTGTLWLVGCAVGGRKSTIQNTGAMNRFVACHIFCMGPHRWIHVYFSDDN